MKSFTEPIQPENFYHFYNRGINGCNLFITRNNYLKFMGKYILHTEKIVSAYAYSFTKESLSFSCLCKVRE